MADFRPRLKKQQKQSINNICVLKYIKLYLLKLNK